MCRQAKRPLEKAKIYMYRFIGILMVYAFFLLEENILLVSKSSDTSRIHDLYFDKQARYVSIELRCPTEGHEFINLSFV